MGTVYGVLTGGGDCPGLNAAIKWVVKAAKHCEPDATVLGLREGWESLVHDLSDPAVREIYVEELDEKGVRRIDRDGGTALGTSRTNPFSKRPEHVAGRPSQAEEVVRNFERLELDGLVVIGGEDTLGVAAKLYERGLPVVGIPKTIDLDLPGTEYSLGFDSAVNNIRRMISNARTVAGSHRRIAVVEVMGRHCGFLALYAGATSGAFLILIPECPFDLARVCSMLAERARSGARYSIVVVSEGAFPMGGQVFSTGEKDAFGHVRLGGVGHMVAREIRSRTGLEAFADVLGYVQRGGEPSAFDVRMGRYFGTAAVELLRAKRFGQMVAVRNGVISAGPITDALGPARQVDVDEFYDRETYNLKRSHALGWPVL